MASNAYQISDAVTIIGTVGIPGIIFVSNGTNSVDIKAPVGLVGNVDFTLPATAGTTGQFMQRTGAAASAWTTVSQFNTNSSLPMFLKFTTGSGVVTTANSASYVLLSSFIYRGTGTDNVITSASAVISTSAGTTGQIRIVDRTSTLVICETAVFGPSTTVSIISMGVISNLPVAQTIFEVQMKRVGGGGTTNLVSLQLCG